MKSQEIIKQLRDFLDADQKLTAQQKNLIELAILELEKNESIEQWIEAVELIASVLSIGSLMT